MILHAPSVTKKQVILGKKGLAHLQMIKCTSPPGSGPTQYNSRAEAVSKKHPTLGRAPLCHQPTTTLVNVVGGRGRLKGKNTGHVRRRARVQDTEVGESNPQKKKERKEVGESEKKAKAASQVLDHRTQRLRSAQAGTRIPVLRFAGCWAECGMGGGGSGSFFKVLVNNLDVLAGYALLIWLNPLGCLAIELLVSAFLVRFL